MPTESSLQGLNSALSMFVILIPIEWEEIVKLMSNYLQYLQSSQTSPDVVPFYL